MSNTEKDHWSFTDLYNIRDFPEILKKLENNLPKFTEFFAAFSPEMPEETFKKFINFSEKFNEELAILSALPFLKEQINQKDQHAKMLKSQIKILSVKVDDITRPLWHWLKGKEVAGKKVLNDNNAERLFKSVPKLYYSLQFMRQEAKYTLTEKEESIITKKDMNGQSVIQDLRDIIDTEQTYLFKQYPDKPARKITTYSELAKYFQSPRHYERKAAYQAEFTSYKANIAKYFLIYESIVKDWAEEAKMRGYKSAISVRNVSNDIADETVNNLIDVCTENKDIFYEYFQYKAHALNMDKMNRFDLYAPLTDSLEKKVDYQKSKEMVLQTYSEFSPGFAEKAKMIFTSQHVDSHPDPVKVSGAFCATIAPRITPFLLLNYTERLRDVLVMAHELGHGIHSLFSDKQSYSEQEASIPLAETASTFGEMLMFYKLYNGTTDKKMKKALLMEKLSDTYATIMRQNYFIKFELEAHKLLPTGISQNDLSNVYYRNLQEQFDGSVIVPEEFQDEWAVIPHIYATPFYCYAYSFGNLLSLSLYHRYQVEGSKFIPRLEEILAAGSSAKPAEILAKVGIDINQKSFWQEGFAIIKNWVEQLLKL